MKTRFLLTIVVAIAFPVIIFGQSAPARSLANFAGKWKVDLEKSFSRSEREKLSWYTVTLAEEDDALIVDSEFTIDGSLSRIRETFSVDKKEHRYQRKEFPIQKALFFDFGHFLNIRSYRATLTENSIKITFRQPLSDTMSAYFDKRTYELSTDDKTLTIETVIRSARPGDATRNQKKRLILTRQP